MVLSVTHRDSFDAIYGASAGAINATYFLTGQREGVDIYAEDIANRTFCDLSRLLGPSKSAAPRRATPAARHTHLYCPPSPDALAMLEVLQPARSRLYHTS